MEKNKLLFTQLLSSYFLLGGTICLIYFISQSGFIGILSTLMPSLITLIILLFFIFSGLIGLLSKNVKVSKGLLYSCLIIQSIQVVIFGFTFKNYFGPYLGIGFSESPELEAVFSFRSITYFLGNGLKQGSSEVSLVINLVPLSILVMFYKFFSN